jgi:hypothetical protein
MVTDLEQEIKQIEPLKSDQQVITPELLLQYKNLNFDVPLELTQYIDKMKSNKKPKDIESFWKRDTKSNSLFLNKQNQTDTGKLYSDMNDLLNKISDGNFDTICNMITGLPIVNSEHMEKLVEKIIGEALVNTKYMNLYAGICLKLMPFSIIAETEKIHFRDILFTKCQDTFEKYTKNKDNVEKEKLIGLVRFLGELYKLNVITSCVIFMCFIPLYTNVMSKKPNAIEALCTLMTIVGKDFFKKDNLKATSCFSKIEQILHNGGICAKDKFAIMDLVDKKNKENWTMTTKSV